MHAHDHKPAEPLPLPAPLLASLRKAYGRTPLLRALMHAVPVDENSSALQALGLLNTWPTDQTKPKGGETIAIGRTPLGRTVVAVADYLDRNDAAALAPTITPKVTHGEGVGIVIVKVGTATLLVGTAIRDAAIVVVPPKSFAREDVQDAKAQILCGPCALEVAVAKAVAFAKTVPQQAPVHDFAQQTKGKAIAFLSPKDPHREMTEVEIRVSPAVVGHCSIHLPNGLVCGEYVRHGIPPGVTCSCKPAPRPVVGTLHPDVSSKA